MFVVVIIIVKKSNKQKKKNKQHGPNANPVWHRTLTDQFGTRLFCLEYLVS